MILTSLLVFSSVFQSIVYVATTTTANTIITDEKNENVTTIKITTTESPRCPDFSLIENGYISQISSKLQQILLINCDEGYDLNGPSIIYCKEGNWDHLAHVECSKRCKEPPHLENGRLDIDSDKDDNGLYHKGTVATYICENNYQLSPKESQYRVCEKGIWTGQMAFCIPYQIITGCSPPKPVLNGYFVHEKNDIDNDDIDGGSNSGYYSIGQRLHYSCNAGYILEGDSVQLCLDDGTWSPKIPPICSPQIQEEESNDFSCLTSPHIPHSYTTVIHGLVTETGAAPGTTLKIQCNSLYRNIRAPCQPGKLRCINGRWEGVPPICVPAHGCDPPPAVSYAVIYNLNDISFESTISNKYPVKSQISYQCLNGYTLQGNEVFACSTEGCWLPVEPPTCYRSSDNYYLEVNSWNAVLVSTATGAGVLTILLIICLITVCRRRRPLSRSVTTIPPPVTRTNLGDHATLLHHPDRLALIAFADGLQNNNNTINNNNDENALPTYEEATRERGHISLQQQQQRPHRPHWPNLSSTRRSIRNVPNLDIIHIPRHGSFASHTPSTRSAGDSMGSTDTVALSEGSTNVTLDTASSYSGSSSQPASCRVHCGSLASFDTSSVVNTEGVPLLEESELEEIQIDDSISLVVDNPPSISDSASMKLSNNSADLA